MADERIAAYLEVGAKRTFACAVEWPGWSRSGRSEDDALAALAAYAERYRHLLPKSAAVALVKPVAGAAFDVVERIAGGSGTDFGVPSATPQADRRALDDADLDRQGKLLRAAWEAFDRAASAAVGATLSKGPRGGGRVLDAIVGHVLEADEAYLRSVAGTYRRPAEADAAEAMAGLRAALLETLAERAHGVVPPLSPRRTAPLWAPRYLVRRSAWHALDHAWEIEDRAQG